MENMAKRIACHLCSLMTIENYIGYINTLQSQNVIDNKMVQLLNEALKTPIKGSLNNNARRESKIKEHVQNFKCSVTKEQCSFKKNLETDVKVPVGKSQQMNNFNLNQGNDNQMWQSIQAQQGVFNFGQQGNQFGFQTEQKPINFTGFGNNNGYMG